MNALTWYRPDHAWTIRRATTVMLLALLLAWTLPAAAAEPAGRVISLAGTVRAADADGTSRTLARGDAVHAGDTLTLGPRAHAQIRMRDDALIELEAGSRFAIPVYGESAAGASAVMRLLRGAMRTITGTIGDGPEETYQVDTPVATIGIRGTEYALHYCGADCASEDRDAGLYGRVDAGAVVVRNQAAQRVFREREYFYVAAQDVAPRQILRPPAGILDGGAVSEGALQRDPGAGGVVDAELGGDLETTVDGVGTTLGNTVDGTGEVVEDTIGGTVDLADDTISGVGDLAGDTLGDTLDGDLDAGQTLGGTADLAGDTLDGTTDLADDTLDGAADTLGTTVDDTTNTVNDVSDLLDSDG